MPIPIDYERIIQDVYEAVLHPGAVAIDIGAHRGRHTLPLVRCVAPSGNVFAVEPLPACQVALQQEIQAHANLPTLVEILPFALSDQAGKASFVVAEDHLDFSGLREVPYPTKTKTSRITVEVETLDNLFLALPRLDYLKVDAEGAELHILRGGLACLERFRPVVGFEFGTFSNRQYQVTPQDMAEFWHEQDCHVYAITGQLLSPGDFCRCAETRDIWDYVAVPREDAARNHLIRRTLNRPRVNWLAVRAELNHAGDHANVGANMPPLKRFRGPLRPIARGLAWLFLQAARLITSPQRLYNRSLLLAMQQLVNDLEKQGRDSQQREKRMEELDQQIKHLQRELKQARQEIRADSVKMQGD